MADFRDVQRQRYSRSAGGSQPFNVQAPSTGDLVAPSQNQSISRPGTYRPTNLLPGENPNIPRTYTVPTQGTGQQAYNTVDVPATRVDTPRGQLSGTASPNTISGSPNAGSLPASSNPGTTSPSALGGMNGGSANPSVGNGSNPNYQPSGISGGGGNNILRGLGGLAGKLSGLSPLLTLPLDGLFPDAAGEGEGEYLKKNAGKLKPDPNLNGEKSSPAFKGNGYPKLPKPKKQDSFKGGQDDALWLWTGTYTYKYQGETYSATFNNGQAYGIVAGVANRDESGYKVPYATYVSDGVSRLRRGNALGYQDAPAENIKHQFTRVGAAPKPEDTAPRDFPDIQPNPGFNPAFNSDPTLQPLNPPGTQGSPAGQKTGQPNQGVQPGKNPKDGDKKQPDNPLAPFLPLVPFLPLIPSLFPPGSPNQQPNQSPSGNPSPSPTSSTPAPLAPFSPTATPSKAPTTGDKPGEFPKPEPKPQPQPQVPNIDPTESGKCCPSHGESLDEIKRVLGVGEFPAVLPLLNGKASRSVGNIPELLLWTNSNIDCTQGNFPATVTVVKGDSTEKSFTLNNAAHAFEELFAALLTVAQDADATVNIAARTATEVVNTKIAVQQGNQL